jgi:hypothetical protein
VDELFHTRHQSELNSHSPFLGAIADSHGITWPFDESLLLPDFSSSETPSITIDPDGKLWINSSVELYLQTGKGFENIQAINGGWGIDEPDLKQSKVLGFNTRVFYYEFGKRPYWLPWKIDPALTNDDTYFAVDGQERIWFYRAEKGLGVVDQGEAQYLGLIPSYLPQTSIGGILKRKDGPVWVGARGAIWEFDRGAWRQLVVPGADELFRFFVEDDHGVVYGATDTAVYRFEGGRVSRSYFVVQDHKPIVVPEDGKQGDCVFNKNYTVLANCPGISWGELSPKYHYKAVFLGMEADGSVVYANNYVVARLQDQKWKGFLFDSTGIASAAVGQDGAVWIFFAADGLIRLESGVFDTQ